ncbi:MAG TPA: cobalamin-independent methionine synthase II family protein [Gammaproteobacteria bacterium]|nr:cobalamin-independent methionine synthase II family protein [Gammaproteobacteria bacterium]
MKRSTERMLTTHAGRLEGPPAFRQLTGSPLERRILDPAALEPQLHDAAVWVLRQQTAAGIDVVSDGEVGKLGFGLAYYGRRLTGLASRKLGENEPGWMSQRTGERIEFADFYKDMGWLAPAERVVCSGPIRYIGEDEIAKDLGRYKAALSEAEVQVEDAFVCALAPAWLEHFFHNEFYAGDEEYLMALAEAMRHEYRAIVDAGFILQIDDPALPDTYDMIVPAPEIADYRAFAAVRIEALNHALEGLPEDRVRYHICWGSWHGPHTHDLPLEHVVDLMLEVNAGAYSVEAANPRHEHEWKIWRETKLPDGKILIPGVISHATNVVEHPELVADRIVRYAELLGRENIIAGTDCGLGFRVHPQIAWAKLKALAEGAALASGRLWL